MEEIIFLIGIVMIIISGCGMIDEFGELYVDNISYCSSNVSYAPTERFCNDINMEHYEYGNTFVNFWSCVDKKGEVHSYTIRGVNNEYWIIGDKTYDMEWSC